MKTNESLKNIFPDSSNQFTNVNQPCACLSTSFLEQTGINGTRKGQKQHKHIGIFWADHHCVITTLHVAVDEWQPPLGSCITPALPLFCLQKSLSISPHTWHTALFSISLNSLDVLLSLPFLDQKPYQACFVLHLDQLNQLWGGYVHYFHSRRLPLACCFLYSCWNFPV